MQNEMQNEIVYLYLDDIIPNRFQPREIFDDEALKELAISIKEHGVIQPIIVRQVNNKYEIIAGERRYKAATMAGLTKIPAIVKNLDDKESSKVALIENLQRKDLTPIEEARTYQKILELDNMTQDALAQTMGKTQSAVSNKLRLLALPDEVQDALLKEQISERHARSLLNVSNKNDQIKLLDKIISTRMTVKELDKEIKMLSGNGNSDDVTKVPSNFDILTNNVKEEVAPPTYVSNSSAKLNPTMVDIDKIRQNSVDINQPERPVADIAELMKVTTKEEPPKENDFKFIPGAVPNAKPLDIEKPVSESSNSVNPALFGFENMATSNNSLESFGTPKSDSVFEPLASFVNTSSNTSQSDNANDSLNNIFPNIELSSVTTEQSNNNLNVSSTNSLNLGSNSFLNQFGLNGPTNENKSVQSAVADIKRVVHAIEESGFVINVQENDNGDKYQIVINIDKK